MVPINEITAGTALAAVRGGDDIRVYVTATNGDIREVRYHNGLWTGGTSVDFITNGNIRGPLATTRGNIDDIHLFYAGSGNTLLEAHKKNNGSSNGSLSNLVSIVHLSRPSVSAAPGRSASTVSCRIA